MAKSVSADPPLAPPLNRAATLFLSLSSKLSLPSLWCPEMRLASHTNAPLNASLDLPRTYMGSLVQRSAQVYILDGFGFKLSGLLASSFCAAASSFERSEILGKEALSGAALSTLSSAFSANPSSLRK